MKSSTTIFLFVVLFLIYCIQHRNQISEIIESFTQQTGEANLLPPIVNGTEINIPYTTVVGGSISYDSNNNGCLIHTATSGNSYTNHFMFTPLHKTKKLVDNDNLEQRTYVLSVECQFKASDNINLTSTPDAEVELWIFGLNKGRRHYVDQSYQDFKSIIKNIPKSDTWTTLELKYQPLNLNTEYIAIRFDNNKDVGISSQTVRWKNPKLEVYNPDTTSRRPDCQYATPYAAGPQLYGTGSGNNGALVKASALAVNKFCHTNAILRIGDLNDKKVDKNLKFEDGNSGNFHLVHSRINSYFPIINNKDNINSGKHFEQYIKVNLKFALNVGGTNPISTAVNIIDTIKFLFKTFTYNLSLNKTDFYTKNLFGYLKKMYYNNDDRLNITDITIANDVIGDKSKLTLGNFFFRCTENSNFNNSISNLIGKTYSDNAVSNNFSSYSGSGNLGTNQIIILPLNIYINSPKSIDNDHSKLKSDIKSFLNRSDTFSIPGANFNIQPFNSSDNSKSDFNGNDIFESFGNRLNTESKPVANCTTYNGDRSQCTATATEVSGIGSQVQECSCTRCSTNTSVRAAIVNSNHVISGEVETEKYLLPGHGNPFYFCNRQENKSCENFHQNETTCNETDGCSYIDSYCRPTCKFNFPPDYSTPTQGPNFNLSPESSLSSSSNPYVHVDIDTNNAESNFHFHTKLLTQNSCQVYNDGQNSLNVFTSNVNMNHFRNCNLRLDRENRPIDLSLCFYPYLTSDTAKKLYYSVYRGKEFFWYKNDNNSNAPEILTYNFSISNTKYYFLNISQNSNNSFKNLKNNNDFSIEGDSSNIEDYEFSLNSNSFAGNSILKEVRGNFIIIKYTTINTLSQNNNQILIPINEVYN